MIFMDTNNINQKIQSSLGTLESRLDELIHVCEQLAEENRLLREQQAALIAERDELLEKNELSRTRIEAMITRMKALEQ